MASSCHAREWPKPTTTDSDDLNLVTSLIGELLARLVPANPVVECVPDIEDELGTYWYKVSLSRVSLPAGPRPGFDPPATAYIHILGK